MNVAPQEPSEQSKIVLASLKKAAADALEKKRKLGEYAVLWENGKVVYKGEDAPGNNSPIDSLGIGQK